MKLARIPLLLAVIKSVTTDTATVASDRDDGEGVVSRDTTVLEDNIALDSEDSLKSDRVETAQNVSADSVSDETDRAESDPGNTYLQVGQWIAQWDAPYEAWYYYNSQSGVSTWSKPTELEGIEFTDPVPDIVTAKQKVKEAHQAHVNKEKGILEEVSKGPNSIRDERDKPVDPFGVTAGQQLHSTSLPQTKDKGVINSSPGYFPSPSPGYYGPPQAKPQPSYAVQPQKPPAPVGKPLYSHTPCRRLGGLGGLLQGNSCSGLTNKLEE